MEGSVPGAPSDLLLNLCGEEKPNERPVYLGTLSETKLKEI